jgi:hypothetical protein
MMSGSLELFSLNSGGPALVLKLNLIHFPHQVLPSLPITICVSPTATVVSISRTMGLS